MFRRFASLPVRNAGTLAGNLANGSPIGDSMPALIAVDTRVSLRRGDQTRELLLEALYLDYMKNAMQQGEFIESIIIPQRNSGLQLRCYKLCKRFDQDISAICAAFALRLDDGLVTDIRIAFGGMAAIPKRATQTEKALLGKPWQESALKLAGEALQQDFSPLSDMRASASYRSRTAANLLRRFYLETRPQSPLATESVNVFAESL
jgi:xanthine dehydrogenase small subunit